MFEFITRRLKETACFLSSGSCPNLPNRPPARQVAAEGRNRLTQRRTGSGASIISTLNSGRITCYVLRLTFNVSTLLTPQRPHAFSILFFFPLNPFLDARP